MRAKVVIAVEFLGSVSEVEEEANEEVEEEAQKDEAEIQVSCGLGQNGAFIYWYMPMMLMALCCMKLWG
ncbi:hypothetical protein DKX38_017944 [Salix brachista]|uniref:Uncharacterized protein n=1 Tax=Salix brachista TaxID=2182728 RepID=A0A5N5KXF8_9ROSI|nr:hypothetical protein DKX38_017944 [Salix brachista]